ncbi:follistatin-related protein 1 [Drosophila miranda]|uniref:Follistatin-related protein 1 n=1 Tax=Drosophila pseudoobscura pseudoobscura TaxID=46245 RepID=A0A0R3P8J7_DROPS|nr:follistatin-related protein 1 [Drosophila pseudoobscura]XP_017135190.1 follistatin-related protein 1 [Drosophila miranda]XP_026847437.1 follistatin-related protein 1 [Drosophila persimilis]
MHVMFTLTGKAATKIVLFCFLISIVSILFALCVSLPLKQSSSACMAIETCDPFKPICATSINEHQFFYSQCEMVRDICLTGKDWKSDYLSHCNVSKL